jgi:hypothetical protein
MKVKEYYDESTIDPIEEYYFSMRKNMTSPKPDPIDPISEWFQNIEVEGVDYKDHPDYCDAYVSYAEHLDGTPLTGDELEALNEKHPELAQEHAFESLLD